MTKCEQNIEEGQSILKLWEKVTSKPLTNREIEFYRLAFEAGRAAGFDEAILEEYKRSMK